MLLPPIFTQIFWNSCSQDCFRTKVKRIMPKPLDGNVFFSLIQQNWMSKIPFFSLNQLLFSLTRVTRTQLWIGCKRRIGAREEELLFSLESMQDVMTTFRSRIAIAVLIDFVDFWWISFLSKWLIEFVLENPLFSWKTTFDHRDMPVCKERNYLLLGS